MKPSAFYLYGTHAALAALTNPMRKIRKVLLTKNAPSLGKDALKRAQTVEVQKLESFLPKDAVHQGIAVECEPLAQPSLQEWLLSSPHRGEGVLLLDQITDPHNVGAILRSAAAFGIGAVVTPERNAALESGVMAKAASGALEIVPLISVVNLAQAVELLKKFGYWIYGLDGEAEESINAVKFDAKTALVLGAEGRGLRRLTAERCDFLVKIPMSGRMESLNVANAAAVAMYELHKK